MKRSKLRQGLLLSVLVTIGPLFASIPSFAQEPPAKQPDSKPSGPGSFSVDLEAAERALERNLTQTGALLLRPGQFDFEPSFTYSRRETSYPTVVDLGGSLSIAPVEQELNVSTLNLAMKIGLPWDSQFELALPFSRVDQTLLIVPTLGGSVSSDNSSSGLGDVSVGLAKTLLRERGWRPDLIGRVTYNAGNGERSDNGVPRLGGNRSVQLSVTALQRQDPLAFVGNLSYTKPFEKDHIKQGDQIGLSLGVVLAASPQTSLQFSFSQSFAQKAELNGTSVPGSEQTIGAINLGASVVLTKTMLLNTVLTIGLSDDAPDYAIQFALPIRFN